MHEMEKLWELLTSEGYTITIQLPVCEGGERLITASKNIGKKIFSINMNTECAMYLESGVLLPQFKDEESFLHITDCKRIRHDSGDNETLLQFVERMLKQ